MKFTKANHNDYIYMLVRKLVYVASRDDLPDLPKEVISKLDRGKAHLFIGERCGAVLEVDHEDNEIVMYVVFGWSDNGHGISDYINAYYRLAKDVGAKRIVSLARKAGVYRLWRAHGFKKVGYNEQGLIRFEKRLVNNE
ncbi:hypothetical protein H2C82_14175 [Vibrio parahaemolyticus]|uniref:hypothetical protein n=1 Tax=Vibrio parahaemolyticus TaxID=670 RepID=UPI00211A1F05|nr:hypothetical protein [Vibrio parahaemolyticus]MCQ9056194.1 hypothetical protein [Vibrio parahaemolyticus]